MAGQCLGGVCRLRPWRVRPHRVRPHIDSFSDQVLQIYLSLTEKKDNFVPMIKQNMFICHSLIHCVA